jgi:hypothetical protein
MAPEFNPNSLDATLATIIQKQSDMQQQMANNHECVCAKIDAVAEAQAATASEVESLKKWKWQTVGGAGVLSTLIAWLWPK